MSVTTKPLSATLSRVDTHFAQWWAQHCDLPGWFGLEAAATCDVLLDWQCSTLDAHGHLAEIGVYRGRSASLLATRARANEELYLVDVSRDAATEEMLARIVSRERVHFFGGRSSRLAAEPGLRAAERSCRWVNVDGEHTGEAMWNDLDLAARWLDDRGVICVDDFFQPMYPQVTAATFDYLDRHKYALTLFLVGFYKAFICRPVFATRYLDAIRHGLAEAMAARGVEVTVTKTTEPSDMNCFGVIARSEDMAYRGLDWDKTRLP
jgi:Methyltransferase domain